MHKETSSPYSEIHKKSFRAEKFPFRETPGTHIEKLESEEQMQIFKGHAPEEYLAYIENLQGSETREAFKLVCDLARDVQSAGGSALLVGGCVRDEVLGKPSKDFDIEIYGLTPEKIRDVAKSYGSINEVGKAFGILKLISTSGIDLDLSLPRMDSKIREGHKGFDIEVDPDMSIAEAAKRRDFTFNALAKDPLSGKIYDPFGGIEDLRKRILRVTDPEKFRDDPLRILRAAQFVGRFGLRIDPASMELMREMVPEMKDLSKERIGEEWDKLLLKSDRPSMGLQALLDIGVIEKYFPELASLEETPQEFEWHPEGDVWVHTLMVTDAASQVVKRNRLPKEEATVVMYGALCHDLGKPLTTNEEDGRIRSLGHEPAGEEPTRKLLEKLGVPKKITEAVIHVVKEHLWPSTMYLRHSKGEPISEGAFRRLAKRIDPANIATLTYVAEADHIGRGPFIDKEHQSQLLLPDIYAAGKWIRERAEEIGVYKEVPKPLLQGRDLLTFGFEPGPDFGEIINLSEELRNEQGWTREQILEVLSIPNDQKTAILTLKALLAKDL